MPKWVELTWKTPTKRVITEKCWLVSEEDPVFMIGSSEPLSTVGAIVGDMVMFEDDDGLFGVPPQDVIEIKMLED
jgi:hypothetical protein